MRFTIASTIEKRVRLSCYLALAALGLIVWSLVQPAPLPVVGAMSVGQLLGTLSLAFFLYAIVADLRPALARLRVRAAQTAVAGEPAPAHAPAPAPEPAPALDPKDERKAG